MLFQSKMDIVSYCDKSFIHRSNKVKYQNYSRVLKNMHIIGMLLSGVMRIRNCCDIQNFNKNQRIFSKYSCISQNTDWTQIYTSDNLRMMYIFRAILSGKFSDTLKVKGIVWWTPRTYHPVLTNKDLSKRLRKLSSLHLFHSLCCWFAF